MNREPRVYIITNRNPIQNERQLNDDRRYDFIRTQDNLSIPPYLLYLNNGRYHELFTPGQVLDNVNRLRVLNQLFHNSVPQDAILFVHGFNNSIVEAQAHANEILAATQKNVIVFSWPCSYDNWKPASSYAIDSEMAVTSVRILNWILDFLLDSIQLDIIAHSMGSRIVVGSISNLAHDYRLLEGDRNHPLYSRYTRRITLLQNIIFVEPDIDIINMTVFVSKALPTLNSEQHIIRTYIYAHKDDKALQWSQAIHYNRPRVGQLTGAKTLLDTLRAQPNIPNDDIYLTIINASECGTVSRLISKCLEPYGNHSYFNEDLFRDSIKEILSGASITVLQSTIF